MHSAPALNYPVGRSRLQIGVLCVTGSVSIPVGLFWQYQPGSFGWRQALYASTVLAFGLAAVWAWRRTPGAGLRWDGQFWCLDVASERVSGALAVHPDFQSCMVLSPRTENGSRIWLWPERRRDPAFWSALRRAVYSSEASRPAKGSGVGALDAQVQS